MNKFIYRWRNWRVEILDDPEEHFDSVYWKYSIFRDDNLLFKSAIDSCGEPDLLEILAEYQSFISIETLNFAKFTEPKVVATEVVNPPKKQAEIPPGHLF